MSTVKMNVDAERDPLEAARQHERFAAIAERCAAGSGSEDARLTWAAKARRHRTIARDLRARREG